MLYCFIANECVQIQSAKELRYAKERTLELNKAMMMDLFFDSYLDFDQFTNENLDEINKKIYLMTHDPNVYEKVNMGPANHFSVGYRKVALLSQVQFDNAGNVIITE